MKTRWTWGGLLAIGLLWAGCASAPNEQLEAAQRALQAADSAEADVYVADLYRAAQDSLAAAQAEIEAQNARFALARDYKRAEQLLQFVAETAQQATQQVAERKEALRAETEALIAEARQALMQTHELLGRAPRGKEGAIALVSIREDATSVEGLLNEASAALERGDVFQAHQLAQQARDRAAGLVNELNEAIAKTRPGQGS